MQAEFRETRPIAGDHGRAFGLALASLTSCGFRVTDKSAERMELVGPGMNNSRQSPLVGASRIVIRRSGENLELEADLGGVRTMERFVTLFPTGMPLLLGAILGAVFWLKVGPGWWIWVIITAVGANFALWMVLGPIIARSMRRRTTSALEALLTNMAAA